MTFRKQTAIALALLSILAPGCSDDASGAAGPGGGELATTGTGGLTSAGTGDDVESTGARGQGGDEQAGPSGTGGLEPSNGSAGGTGGMGGVDAASSAQSGPGGTGGAGSGGGGSSGETTGAGGEGGARERHNLLLEAGFEGDDPWAGFVNQQHCCDHSVTQSSAHARTGSSSFRAEVRADDPPVSSGYRAELTLDGISDVGEKWYGFAIYFETPTSGGAWTGHDGHFVQWHPDNGSGSASLGLWSYGEGWLVGLNPEGDGGADLVEVGLPIEADRWHDVVLHVDWDGGIVQFFLDGVLEVDVSGVDYASGPGQYMKFGINRWGGGPNGSPEEDDWVIYYDDLRIGDENATYADVAP